MTSLRWLAIVAVALTACGQPDVPPPRPAAVPIRTELVQANPFQPALLLFGEVRSRGRVPLVAPVSGRVRYAPRFADGLRSGTEVRAGEVLLFVDNDDVEFRLSEARLDVEAASAELERARLGAEAGVTPTAELRRLEIEADRATERLAAAHRQKERLALRAPISGRVVVEEDGVATAEEVTAGAPVAVIATAGLPAVEAWATSADLERLRVGLEARVRRPGRDVPVAEGAVEAFSRELDTRGVARVEIAISEDSGLPPVGEGVEIDLLLETRDDVLTVPESSLLIEGGLVSVFVVEPSGTQHRARRRTVTLGTAREGRVEIVDGLRGGERVATAGVELLTDAIEVVDTQTEDG